jgi:microcystin-dependent protein
MRSTLERLNRSSGVTALGLAAITIFVAASLFYTDKAPAYAQIPGDAPVGTVVAYAGILPRNDDGTAMEVVTNWYLCNGAPLNSNQFRPLYNRIRAHHGNGSDDSNAATDFNLPDYRGLFLRGVNGTRTGDYADPNTSDADRRPNHPGGTGVGNRVGSVQPDDFQEHDHPINDPGHSHGFEAFREDGAGAPGQAFPRNPNGFRTGNERTNITVLNRGGRETRPNNAYVYFLVRVR